MRCDAWRDVTWGNNPTIIRSHMIRHQNGPWALLSHSSKPTEQSMQYMGISAKTSLHRYRCLASPRFFVVPCTSDEWGVRYCTIAIAIQLEKEFLIRTTPFDHVLLTPPCAHQKKITVYNLYHDPYSTRSCAALVPPSEAKKKTPAVAMRCDAMRCPLEKIPQP
jgi:hypothetical protein